MFRHLDRSRRLRLVRGVGSVEQIGEIAMGALLRAGMAYSELSKTRYSELRMGRLVSVSAHRIGDVRLASDFDANRGTAGT